MTAEEPKLAPPGAGIPWPQRMLMTYLVRPLVADRSDWLENARGFSAVTAKLLNECEGLSEQVLGQRALVPPQRGLEDSSRFWSIAMALEHLVIVGSQIELVIAELTNERVPIDPKSQRRAVVDTAKVKPFGSMPPSEALEKFRQWAVGAEQRVLEASRSHTSRARLAHPWFGPFNSKQWQWLMTQHQAIHLRQIRAIKRELRITATGTPN